MRRILALLSTAVGLVLLVPLLPAGAALHAGTTTLQASGRTLEVTAVVGQPWTAILRDRTGREVLRTIGSGAFSAVTPDGRAVAGDVVSVDADGTATLATSDPDVTLKVRTARTMRGFSLDVRAVGARATAVAADFVADAGDSFLGLGERSHAVDQRGERVENRVLDGPYTDSQSPLIKYFVPAPGFSPRADATYFPVPWAMSPRGWGVLVGNDRDSAFEFAVPDRPDRWRVEVETNRLWLDLFAEPRPAALLRRLTAAIGRQPALASPAVTGVWWQPAEVAGSADALTQLREQRAQGVPVSVAQTYTHYFPCGAEDRAGDRDRTAAMHDLGVSVTTYVNPMMCVGRKDGLYDRGVQTGAFTRNPDGSPLVYKYSTASNFQVSQLDFSAPAGNQLFHEVLDQTVDDGYDGWMEDFGEYTPDAAVSADGTPGPVMHNKYPEQYHRSAREYAESAPRPLLRFNRSGWTDAVRESSIVWGGDPSVDWGFDGLASSVTQGLTMGLSGVSVWGPDIGGFFFWWDSTPSTELLNRWIEYGAFTGVMRLQAGGIDLNEGLDRPLVTDPAVAPVWKKYARLRTRLHPYVAGSQDAYQRSGMPLMRHHALTHPGDARAVARHDQYLFGKALLVAPVVAEGAREREAYLPAGSWLDLNQVVALRVDGDYRMRRGEVLRGRRIHSLPAPERQIPLLVRAGSVIPLVPRDVETLSEYDGGLVSLADRTGRRDLLAFPRRGLTTGTLGAGERLRSHVNGKRWRLALGADRRRHYTVQASFAAMPSTWRPCSVRVGDRKVAFEWRGKKRVLSFATRVPANGKVVVRRCG